MEDKVMMDNVFAHMEKLTNKDRVKTYFTVEELRPNDPYSDQVRRVILPVNVYEIDGMGFEIMPVNVLAKHCPWDMEKTLVRIKTDYTDFDGILHDIVVEDAEVHKHLTQLD